MASWGCAFLLAGAAAALFQRDPMLRSNTVTRTSKPVSLRFLESSEQLVEFAFTYGNVVDIEREVLIRTALS